MKCALKLCKTELLQKRKSNRPKCEVKLARCLRSLIEDLEPMELEFVLKKKKCRAKLHQEWQAFMNR